MRISIKRDERGFAVLKVVAIVIGSLMTLMGALLSIAFVAVALEGTSDDDLFAYLIAELFFLAILVGGIAILILQSRLTKAEDALEKQAAARARADDDAPRRKSRRDQDDEVVISREVLTPPVPERAQPKPREAPAKAQPSVSVADTQGAGADTGLTVAPVTPRAAAGSPSTAHDPSADRKADAPHEDRKDGRSKTDDIAGLVLRSDNLFASLKDLVRHEAATQGDKPSKHRHLASMLAAIGIVEWDDAPVCEAGRLTRNQHYWIRQTTDGLSDDDYDMLVATEAALSLNQDLPEACTLDAHDGATLLAKAALLRRMADQHIEPPDLSASLEAAYPGADPRATTGEWRLRASVVSAAECAVTPFRVVYDLRSNVERGIVALSVEVPRPRCMIVLAKPDDLVATARAYALRLAVLLARQAFAIEERVGRVVVNCHERGQAQTILSLDLTRDFAERLAALVRSDTIEGNGFPSDPSIRTDFDETGWFSSVEPFLDLNDELVSPRRRFAYPELVPDATSDRLRTVTGAQTVADLGINENAPRIAAWEEITSTPWDTTEAAVARLVALRDQNDDITVAEACTRSIEALLSGAVDAGDRATLQRVFVAGSMLERAVERAEAALSENGGENPQAALAALTEALAPIEALGPYMDDETTIYRYFGSIAERIRFNIDIDDHRRAVKLVPDAYFNALSNASIAHAMMGNNEQALRYAEEMMRIAPASIHAALRKVRILENDSRIFEAADLIRSMLRLASTPRDAAICHYRLAYMEWKLGREDLGVACYQRSIAWDTELSKQAREELQDLLESNPQLKALSDDEVFSLLAQEGIPLGCDAADQRRTTAAAALCCDEGVFWAARSLTGILFGLNGDDVMMGVYRSLASQA